MSKATDTLRFLAIHNSWRRGDETFGMQDPAEIGAAIDDAVNLLRRYDELDRQNTLLLEENAKLLVIIRDLAAPHYIIDPELRASKFRKSLENYNKYLVQDSSWGLYGS